MFTQNINFDTDLKALENSLYELSLFILKKKWTTWSYKKGLDCTVAIPKNYGCGIANGNWEEVYKVFKKWHNAVLDNYGADNFTLLICEL